MEKKKYLLGILMVITAAVLWGLDGVVLTPKLFNLPVNLIVFLLHAVPFIFMSFFFYKELNHLKNINKKDSLIFILIALFGGCIGTLSIVKALVLVQFQHLTIVVLLQKFQPIFGILLAKFLLKEKLCKSFIWLTAVAIISGYFLTFGFHIPTFEKEANFIYASLYSLLAAFSFGSSTAFGKFVLKKYSFKTALYYRYGLTTLFMGIYLLITGAMSFNHITKNNWIIIIIITFTTGAAAMALYYHGLKFIKANVATICELAFPISSVLFDYLINGSVLISIQIIAGIIMILTILKIINNQAKLKLI